MLLLNYKRKYRVKIIVVFILGFSIAIGLILFAFKNSIDLYYTPTQLLSNTNMLHKSIRIGGLVEKGSVVKHADLNLSFNIIDNNNSIQVMYSGILPDLFKEGQGVVVLGKLKNKQQFIARQVLAKHDEKYRPPGV
jgi:cytochrome c-type biogenesis protein CcmE